MTKIRRLEIENFRGIKSLVWDPAPGFNCLVGPGDSGKSTILDAIDFCLGARRSLQVNDSDFHRLNHEAPIKISITIGALPERLKSFENYGPYLRSFNIETGEIIDEPVAGADLALTIVLKVESDLEPNWALQSDRDATRSQQGVLWADREHIAPLRIGSGMSAHLGWSRGSLLKKMTSENPATGNSLVTAVRSARRAFSTNEPDEEVSKILVSVHEIASRLGVSIDDVRASLDTSSAGLQGGVAVLADSHDVSLARLGLGSTRLLVAGMQHKYSPAGGMVLVDELEYGLEPHRIIRLLDALGAKVAGASSPQVFATSHSPVVVRELDAHQIWIVRSTGDSHTLRQPPAATQRILRLFPEAFLSPASLFCEGASEVGFMRGLDQHRALQGLPTLMAAGVSLVDAGGCSNIYPRAKPYQALGYQCGSLRDDDAGQPKPEDESDFLDSGGSLFKWTTPNSIEQELFQTLPAASLVKMIEYAEHLHGKELINDHIKSATDGKATANAIKNDIENNRKLTGDLAKKREWFKSIPAMQKVAREIVAPAIPNPSHLQSTIAAIYDWAVAGG